jgi:two-component system, response regulator RegA
MLRKIRRAVVVEDEVNLRSAIAQVVRSWGVTVTEAGTAAGALAVLGTPPPPDLLIVDIRLPDEDAFGVLDQATELAPAPVMVAISGKASPDEAFRLAQYGVRAYLAKPFSIEQLTAEVEAACRERPSIEPLISASVGHIPMREMQREVRRLMMKEALARSDGNRSGAARLLEVSRQAVQQMLRSDGLEEPAEPTEEGADTKRGD